MRSTERGRVRGRKRRRERERGRWRERERETEREKKWREAICTRDTEENPKMERCPFLLPQESADA